MKNTLALLADWANGLFALLGAAFVTGTELQWWYVPIALLLSHLPDIDAVPELIRRGKVSASEEYEHDHRTLIHYPIIALPVCVVLALYGGFWGVLIAIVIPLHLLNDLYGTGWGLQLLWPLNKRHYKLFGRRVNRLGHMLSIEERATLPESETELRVLVSWSETELPSYIRKWGMEDWVEPWYLRLNWVSGTEYVLFAVACILTVLQFV